MWTFIRILALATFVSCNGNGFSGSYYESPSISGYGVHGYSSGGYGTYSKSLISNYPSGSGIAKKTFLTGGHGHGHAVSKVVLPEPEALCDHPQIPRGFTYVRSAGCLLGTSIERILPEPITQCECTYPCGYICAPYPEEPSTPATTTRPPRRNRLRTVLVSANPVLPLFK